MSSQFEVVQPAILSEYDQYLEELDNLSPHIPFHQPAISEYGQYLEELARN